MVAMAFLVMVNSRQSNSLLSQYRPVLFLLITQFHSEIHYIHTV